jgi:signal transduction histidine kinase
VNPRLARALDEAKRAAARRPYLPIRFRFSAVLALCFLLCCGFAVAMIEAVGAVREATAMAQCLQTASLHVAGARAAEPVVGHSHQLREHALDHIAAALAALAEAGAGQGATARLPELDALAGKVEAYRRLVAGASPSETGAAAVRAAGDDVAAAIGAVRERETTAFAGTLRAWERVPLVLLGLLFVLLATTAVAFGKAFVTPIRKLKEFTGRIADGDFTPIPPTRRYRDEFSELTLAVNHMLAALQVHQERCVQAGRLAAVGTITSGIAHELNNPLNNISLTTEALMEEWFEISDEEKWRRLQDVFFETERASEIVKSLLDFTRNQRLDLVPVDVGEVIQRTFRLIQNELALANVAFETELPPGLPKVQGAFDQLRQVFLNLFLNALQAMPRGGLLLVSASVADAGRVCIDVRDTGVGIPPQVVPRIFDPFFTTKEPGKGTGLGLSMTASIVKNHNGEIHVSSELGRGTTFHLCLPVAAAPGRPAGSATASGA